MNAFGHALEHLTYCDKGVTKLRRLLLRELKKLEAGERPNLSPLRNGKGLIPTYCHDTVLSVPERSDADDDAFLAEIGGKLTEIIVEGDYHDADDRLDQVRRNIDSYAQSFGAEAAE